MRIQNLLAHRFLDEDDIHQAARADAYLPLQERDNLVRVLMQSAHWPGAQWPVVFCRAAFRRGSVHHPIGLSRMHAASDLA